MKKLILILSCVLPMAALAENPQMPPSELISQWDAASRQCDNENGGVNGVFNSMFGKKPIPCIQKDLVTGDLTRRGWCPQEVATSFETKVTVWKNCRPANLQFIPLESVKDASSEEIVKDYWFSLDNSIYDKENNNGEEYEFYAARMSEDADELEMRGFCYHAEASSRQDRLVPCTKKELADRKQVDVQKKTVVKKKTANKTTTN